MRSGANSKIKIVGATPSSPKSKSKATNKTSNQVKIFGAERKNSTKFGAGFRQSIIKRVRETN